MRFSSKLNYALLSISMVVFFKTMFYSCSVEISSF